VLEELNFDWMYMDLAMGQYAGIDLPQILVNDKNHAKKVLMSYGFDYEDFIVQEEVWRIYFQAIAFLRTQLLDEGEQFPEDFLHRNSQNDILKLLVDLNHHADGDRRKWICAILRIMHVISHLDKDIRVENFQGAREQIFSLFDESLQKDGEKFFLQDARSKRKVEILRYIKKERKDRNSSIIKLLAKPKTIAHDIYDRLGVRFVVSRPYDCFQLLQIFLERGILSPMNINPFRSINSIWSYEQFKEKVKKTSHDLNRGSITVTEARGIANNMKQDDFIKKSEFQKNTKSSPWYSSLQSKFWTAMKLEIKKQGLSEDQIRQIPVILREEKKYYFPYEMQILDLNSYTESIGGKSRHDDYKIKQRTMARNRVLRDLVL